MTPQLNSRAIRILRWLLVQREPKSTASLAADLGLSQRSVRYCLPVVVRYLAHWDVALIRRRGTGLMIDADPEVRNRIVEDLLDQPEAPRVYTPQERRHLLLATLLWAAPSLTSLEDIHIELEVSKTSSRRDLRSVEPWLERNGLPLVRRPGMGIMVVGSERRIRQVIVQLILETVPEEVLAVQFQVDSERDDLTSRVPVGIRERLLDLPLRQASCAIKSSPLRSRLIIGSSEAVFAVYLAVTIARIRMGHTVEVETGLQRSIRDHPISESVEGLITALASSARVLLDEAETAAITEYLLGLDALETVDGSGDAPGHAVVDRVLELAAEHLHPALAEDMELRRGLSTHLQRLTVRLRHGLPIHNPLLGDVKDRYPDVHKVASVIVAEIADAFAAVIVEDEVSFITMYLSGAMERARLRPRRRAMVVCPSGMATVWVLTSRIQAEFPELDLVEVLSEQKYEKLDHRDLDLVISTIPVIEDAAPVVVVNPLLSAADVAKVRALI